jgi:amino acid adenylation domain-containing protein
MYKTIFKYLEDVAKKYPTKLSFVDNKRGLSYEEFVLESKQIATMILQYNLFNKPIAIFLDKNVSCLTSMMGINYSGNFYTVIDNKMPVDRIDSIFNTLKPGLVLTDAKNKDKLNDLKYEVDLLLIDELNDSVNEEALDKVYERIIDTNPMYILFTSGSTGVPKGVVIDHKSTISYINWFNNAFNIDSDTVFGSQTPFYFSMSVSDIFSTMTRGCTFYIIPKMNFSFPVRLIEYLNENKINTIYWVPSALSIVANFKTFDVVKPQYLKRVLFAGEVMPMKQLNIWRRAIPDALYANLFGPTETVDICSYYIVDREFMDDETLPIGKHCDNCDLMVVNDKGEEVSEGEEGELYVRGSFLSSGYYNNEEKTKEMFVQNPLNKAFPEKVYKTGDIVKYNDRRELIYISRKDFQIKHMGYRIELGEIESACGAISDIDSCVCIYDKDNDKIILYYVADMDEMQVLSLVKKKVPNYMWPQEVIKLETMPYNANGKIDRKHLSNLYKEGNN